MKKYWIFCSTSSSNDSASLWKQVIRQSFSRTNDVSLYLFQKCLDKDPAKRFSCEQLLSHGFFKNFTFKFPESELEDFERLRRVRLDQRSDQRSQAPVSFGLLCTAHSVVFTPKIQICQLFSKFWPYSFCLSTYIDADERYNLLCNKKGTFFIFVILK